MQYLDRIDAIDARAQAVNLSLWRVCRRAKVDYSRISRWRTGDSSPNVRTLEKYIGLLNAELDKIEQRLRCHLQAEDRPAA